ncbi:MAG: dCTP deaminase, partial [Bacilli bacterium]|nr:dCTP deaminase [Bacilli bacterium]
MLSGEEIINQIKEGNIVIEPYDEKNVGANSYYVHLGDELVIYEEEVLECKRPNKTKTIKIPEEGYVIQPGELYLARTVEYTETNNFVPLLNGRFSLAALGITIHITAGFGDNGFKGTWTLEIFCIKPVRIYPNM